MTNIDATLVGAIIGGALSIAGAIAGARTLVVFQSRRNAEQVFSDAVHEILEGMYPEALAWPSDSWHVLQNKMPLMHSAIEKLKFHLKPSEIERIDAAWGKYKKWCQTINDAGIKARPLYQVSTPSIDQKAVFKRHVDAILSYSNKGITRRSSRR